MFPRYFSLSLVFINLSNSRQIQGRVYSAGGLVTQNIPPKYATYAERSDFGSTGFCCDVLSFIAAIQSHSSETTEKETGQLIGRRWW